MNNKNDILNKVKAVEKLDDDTKKLVDLFEDYLRKRSSGTFYQVLSIIFMIGGLFASFRGGSFFLYAFLAVMCYIPYSITYLANRNSDFNINVLLIGLHILGLFSGNEKIDPSMLKDKEIRYHGVIKKDE